MKLAEFSVKNSLLVNLISVFIIIIGIMSMFKIPLDMFPAVDFDVVTVTTLYPGAPAEDVEKFVTIPIEKELKGVSGIKELESSSDEGQSKIGITLDPKVSDKDEVVDEIRVAVDRVRNLPEGVTEDPYVLELKSKERPVIEISVSGIYPEAVKRQYAQALEDKLLDVDGVASVRRVGWRDPEFWVEVDPEKLLEFYVSMDEIIAALKSRNITLPGGQLKTTDTEFSIRITGEFRTEEQIEDVIIRANDSGNWLKIRDVARVKEAFEDEVRIAKINKKPAIAMVVVKSESSDVVSLVKDIREAVKQFQLQLPAGMEITMTNDFSYYVKRRLGVLKNNGIIGFALVLANLFLFLNFVPALVTAIGIPIAIFITIIIMYMFGMSINLVSMLGLIIVLGMLVDDGIIVAENVYRYVESGLSPKEAAIKGTREVIAPVTVTILTTYAAFAPLLFMKDIMGKFIREVPIVVMIALAASLFEAFIILPSHLADFVGRHHKMGKKNIKGYQPKQWYSKLVGVYTKFLKWVLGHRRLFVFGILVPLLVSTMLIWKFKVKFIFFPREGIEQFYVRAEADKGITLDNLNDLIVPVEDVVAQLPPEYMESFRTYLGSIESERGFDSKAKRGTHLGQITVFLTPFQSRDKTSKEIADDIRDQLEDIEGFQKINISQRRGGPSVGKAIEIAVKGERFDILEEISVTLMDRLNTIDGVTDVDTSYEFGKKQLKVIVNEALMRKYYLTLGQIAQSVRTAFKGSIATTVKPLQAEEEIDVVVRFREEDRSQLSAFDKILIPNKFDKLVRLGSIAQVIEEDGIYTINHKDGKRVIHVSAEVDEDVITSVEVNEMMQEEFSDIPADYLGYTVSFGGEFEEALESRKNLLTSFAIALCIIFIMLTTMFKSLVQPFIVMLAIPFGLIGVIIAFYLHGKPLSFFALMGIVGLTGIVVNDSIILVDFINRLQKQGKDKYHSIIEAGQIRLRPVIMTSITTIVGLIAVAYGIGGGDPFLKPLALAIIWGILFSTVLILIMIPCIYAMKRIDLVIIWVILIVTALILFRFPSFILPYIILLGMFCVWHIIKQDEIKASINNI